MEIKIEYVVNATDLVVVFAALVFAFAFRQYKRWTFRKSIRQRIVECIEAIRITKDLPPTPSGTAVSQDAQIGYYYQEMKTDILRLLERYWNFERIPDGDDQAIRRAFRAPTNLLGKDHGMNLPLFERLVLGWLRKEVGWLSDLPMAERPNNGEE